MKADRHFPPCPGTDTPRPRQFSPHQPIIIGCCRISRCLRIPGCPRRSFRCRGVLPSIRLTTGRVLAAVGSTRRAAGLLLFRLTAFGPVRATLWTRGVSGGVLCCHIRFCGNGFNRCGTDGNICRNNGCNVHLHRYGRGYRLLHLRGNTGHLNRRWRQGCDFCRVRHVRLNRLGDPHHHIFKPEIGNNEH